MILDRGKFKSISMFKYAHIVLITLCCLFSIASKAQCWFGKFGSTSYNIHTVHQDLGEILPFSNLKDGLSGNYITPIISDNKNIRTDHSPQKRKTIHSKYIQDAIGSSDTFSSNLPLVFLQTLNRLPYKDSFVEATIKILDHEGISRNNSGDTVYRFNGRTKIKVHGTASLNSPQLSYSLELNDSTGNDTSVQIMGMPPESDWVLLNTWNDRSLIRNPIMYHLYQQMGHYSTRFRYCEVFLNQEYLGLYMFTERIKRDSARIPISKLKQSDLAGDSLTGGYIFKHDYVIDTMGWLSDISPAACPGNYGRYQFEYPNYARIKPEQATYLKDYVNNLESTLYSSHVNDPETGYRKYIDVNSFADYLICHEFAWNGDGFAKSMYFYKDRDSKDGKLYAGPVWDFDWSLKRMPWVDDAVSYWNYETSPCNNLQATLPWHSVMMQDDYFRNLVQCRWQNYRNSFLTSTSIHHFIDSLQNITEEAQVRHYNRWPTWGLSLSTPEKLPYASNMQEELDTLESMIARRMNWIDTHLPGVCTGGTSTTEIESPVKYYPNPAKDFVTITSEEEVMSIDLYDDTGNKIRYWVGQDLPFQIDVRGIKPGIYLLRTQTILKSYAGKLVIE